MKYRASEKTRTLLTAIAVAVAVVTANFGAAANWSVNRVNHMLLTPPAGVTVAEMSGVTYVGPAAGGLYRFIAAEETKGELVQFDLAIDAAGAITSISNVAAIDIVPTSDFEGVAYTSAGRNSVFLSDENSPGVREINLATGAVMQTVTIPIVFTTNKRTNLSFESLTRSPDATVMWTANEQALTVDGPTSTAANGTTVRLLKFNVAGNTVAAGPQFAYNVEPIHSSATFGSPQSGLSDLVYMPDGTLLALERSVAVASPLYLNRVFEINQTGATDVSVGALASGLTGQSYTPLGKQLLWSGAADAASGQNMEGLALGPRLANGSFVLIGVVDDGFGGATDSDPQSSNTIVCFTATAIPSADFNGDGKVDGADLLQLQRGFGKTIGAAHAEGDADRDGDVDAADLNYLKAHFGGASAAATTKAIPEPTAALHSLCGLAAVVATLPAKRTARANRKNREQ
jgi:hypothetical protein